MAGAGWWKRRLGLANQRKKTRKRRDPPGTRGLGNATPLNGSAAPILQKGPEAPRVLARSRVHRAGSVGLLGPQKQGKHQPEKS